MTEAAGRPVTLEDVIRGGDLLDRVLGAVR
jgi:hypothetical protein